LAACFDAFFSAFLVARFETSAVSVAGSDGAAVDSMP
jgi:hypothetical protein